MAILKLIFRKMVNNKWLTGSLFLGLIITVSLVSSIPTYTSSVLQKMLIKELEDYQINKNEFSGEFTFSDTFARENVNEPGEALEKVTTIKKNIMEDANLPVLSEADTLATSPMRTMYEDEELQESSLQPGKIVALTNFEDNITVTDGEYPSEHPVDGVFETLVSEQALQKRDMVLGNVFIMEDRDSTFLVKPVGVYQPKDTGNSYWSLVQGNFSEDFIVDENLFRDEIIQHHDHILGIGRFSTAFDFYEIDTNDIPMLLSLEGKLRSAIIKEKKASILFHFPIQDILRSYLSKGDQLTIMLWSLNVPVLIMLGLYLYMISKLIVERQMNEISVFFSRGTSRIQILMIYFIEISILGLLALLLGPYIGLQLVKILGASNGFLEFIQRTSLPIELSEKAFVYALFAVLASIVMIMIPVYQASGRSIVNLKQESARVFGRQHWSFIVFELLLFGVSIYGLITFNRKQQESLALDGNISDLMIDPILFFIPAIFIIGLGLIILRIYPWILKGVYKIGQKIWSISLYSTFLQVSRSARQYQFLMLFLVMTIGIGVFSASAARTINSTLEEQIHYKNGADIKLSTRWQSKTTGASSIYDSQQMTGSPSSGEEQNQDQSNQSDQPIGISETRYTEPSFEPYTDILGVESIAKVFQKDEVTISTNAKSVRHTSLMAIEPKDFGEVTWFKPSLLPHHWYEYLNLLAKEPSSVLLSNEAAKLLGVKEGDYIEMGWDGTDSGEFIVYGIVDYWPTFNPLKQIPDSNQKETLVVANLPYVQNTLGLEPYDVWLKLDSDIDRLNVYESIEEKQLPLISMDDSYPELVNLKNSGLLLGINGTMTLGFLISLIISFIGFILYWVLTIKSRTLQYGIYRAMGIPMPKLIGILISEQALTSGIACVLGLVIGKITSLLFVPLFKLSLNVRDMVPPFAVVFNPDDEIKIYIFVLIMLLFGTMILIGFLRSIRIHQAIKLGED